MAQSEKNVYVDQEIGAQIVSLIKQNEPIKLYRTIQP